VRRVVELDDESTTTSELRQAHLADSHVVKAFDNIFFPHLASLARRSGDDERSALAIAGDDADAKAEVTRFLDSVGYDAHDVGPLAEGWHYQRDTAAYVAPYAQPDAADFATGHSAGDLRRPRGPARAGRALPRHVRADRRRWSGSSSAPEAWRARAVQLVTVQRLARSGKVSRRTPPVPESRTCRGRSSAAGHRRSRR
jgi:hypothetical protein